MFNALASVKNAMYGVDYIYYASSFKQVPSYELFFDKSQENTELAKENQ